MLPVSNNLASESCFRPIAACNGLRDKCAQAAGTRASPHQQTSGEYNNVECEHHLACGAFCAVRPKAVTATVCLQPLRRRHLRLGARASDAAAPAGDTITVTGSRLRRDTFNSVSPVQLITREEVTAAGFTLGDRSLAGHGCDNGGAQINNAFGGFVTDGGPGANTLSLRGLGAGRTLVLINGRRVAPSGTRGAVGSADLNVLPNAIIDHVEVLQRRRVFDLRIGRDRRRRQRRHARQSRRA